MGNMLPSDHEAWESRGADLPIAVKAKPEAWEQKYLNQIEAHRELINAARELDMARRDLDAAEHRVTKARIAADSAGVDAQIIEELAP